MNRTGIISQRNQQSFIKRNGVILLYSFRACPCDGVNCPLCGGKMHYYDKPTPLNAMIISGNNTSKKESETPMIDTGTYQLILEGRHVIGKHDRVMPIKTRNFEDINEVIEVDSSFLTFTPVAPRLVTITFVNQGSGVLNYAGEVDFTIDLEDHKEAPPLYKKEIKWITDPAIGQKRFSARYTCYPEYEVSDIPPARFSEGQRLMQKVFLSKITLNSGEKTPSFEKSERSVIGGMQYV